MAQTYVERIRKDGESISTVAIPFEVLVGASGADVITVWIDNVLRPEYKAKSNGAGVYTITPAITTGRVIVFQRSTDVDAMLRIFSAGAMFVPFDMDLNFKQILYSQQENLDRFTRLNNYTANTIANFSVLVKQAQDQANALYVRMDAVEQLSYKSNQIAQNALDVANAIDGKATTALTNSTTALNTANAIDGKATNALNDSVYAVQQADEAYRLASGLDEKATRADTNAASALSKVDAATKDAMVGRNNLSELTSMEAARQRLWVFSREQVVPKVGGEFTGRLMVHGWSSKYNEGGMELVGDNGANPTLGFHKPNQYAGSLVMTASDAFAFYKQDLTSFTDLYANRFVAAGDVHSNLTSLNQVYYDKAPLADFQNDMWSARAGWYRLPHGLIIQWGVTNCVGDGDTTAWFPRAFPNVCRVAVATHNYNFDWSKDAGVGVFNLAQSSCTIRNGSGATGLIQWVVIGF